MSQRFTVWEEAREYAQGLADALQLDAAIRKVREYGHWGFNVHLARRNDSDYALAEIVNPRIKEDGMITRMSPEKMEWGVWADGKLLRPFRTKEEAERFNDGLKDKGTVAEIKWIKDAKYLAGQRPEKVVKDYEGYVGKVRRHTIQKNVEPMDKAEHVRLTLEYFEGGRKPIHCAWHIITGQDINVKS